MPRISTDNYDTVASWNGSQDLFVVEQPDGTKVATPAMVKQFIEAGDFEATGEVKDGHGNVLSDKVQCGLYATPVQTIQAKQHTAITIPATFPSTVFAAAVMNTPNAAYVYANVVEITPTKVQVGAYNDYTNSLTGDFKIIYFYK